MKPHELGNIEERIGELRADMNAQFENLRADIRQLQWMVGVLIILMLANLTMTGAILLKLAS